MKNHTLQAAYLAALLLAGCSEKPKTDPVAEAPPPTVERTGDVSELKADKPEQFPLVLAGTSPEMVTLSVTGTVTPDVAKYSGYLAGVGKGYRNRRQTG